MYGQKASPALVCALITVKYGPERVYDMCEPRANDDDEGGDDNNDDDSDDDKCSGSYDACISMMHACLGLHSCTPLGPSTPSPVCSAANTHCPVSSKSLALFSAGCSLMLRCIPNDPCI